MTLDFFLPISGGITFQTPGYVLKSGWLETSGSIFTVATNAAATIDSVLSGDTGATLVKTGAATLTVSDTNFIDNVQINEGEYRVAANSSLFFSDVVLANAPGVALTLGRDSSSASIGSLAGGGAAGGILQPDDQARTVTVSLSGSGTFSGIAQDNGDGKLAVSAGLATFTAANTYSGTTTATSSNGAFTFTGNGSALNSASIAVSDGGILRLDNSAVALASRFADGVPVTLTGGRLELIGNATGAVEERLGAMQFSGGASVASSQPAAAATRLHFSSAQRAGHGTLDVSGTGEVTWDGAANDGSGIIGAYATSGTDWATVDADVNVVPFTSYATDLNTASTTAHVKVVGPATLATDSTRATLNLQPAGFSPQTIDLGGHTLTLADGGLLISGNAATILQTGSLWSAGDELIVINQNALTIAASIGETIPDTSLTKSGAGKLTLTGTNSYSGSTAIVAGILNVGTDAALGSGDYVEFSGGSLQAAQSFISSKGLMASGSAAMIDTSGHDVTFTGPVTGPIFKTGAGTLTLTAAHSGSYSVSSGTLAIGAVTTGYVTLSRGTLMVSGSLSTIQIVASSPSTPSVLEIGGTQAASLTLNSLNLVGGINIALIVNFDLGATAQDHLAWTFASSLTGPSSKIAFNFRDLGGVQTGIDYTLIDATIPIVSTSSFALSDTTKARGWAGTFSTKNGDLVVNFTTVPEPGVLPLLATAGLFTLVARRRSL